MGLSLIFFCHLWFLATSLFPMQMRASRVLLQDSKSKAEVITDENSSARADRSGVISRTTVPSSGRVGGNSGGRSFGQGNGGESGSRSPDVQGGAAVIPIYGAGAANKHRPNHHHSGGSRPLRYLLVSILTTVLVHISV